MERQSGKPCIQPTSIVTLIGKGRIRNYCCNCFHLMCCCLKSTWYISSKEKKSTACAIGPTLCCDVGTSKYFNIVEKLSLDVCQFNTQTIHFSCADDTVSTSTGIILPSGKQVMLTTILGIMFQFNTMKRKQNVDAIQEFSLKIPSRIKCYQQCIEHYFFKLTRVIKLPKSYHPTTTLHLSTPV